MCDEGRGKICVNINDMYLEKTKLTFPFESGGHKVSFIEI